MPVIYWQFLLNQSKLAYTQIATRHGMDNIKPSTTVSAAELSKQTLNWLEKYQLAPTPINYAVVYACCHPNNKNLREEFQHLTTQNKYPDNYLLAELHNKYLQETTDKNDNLAAMHKIIVQLQAECEKSESNVSRYQSKLKNEAGKLEHATQQDSKQIVESILTATEEVQLAQSQFKDNVQSSQVSINQLKLKLKAAQKQAQTDALTGLANRRGMQSYLETLTPDTPISAILFDIDNFKQLNDSYGHGIGDLVLKKVAEQIIKRLDDKYIAVRYGGEEFLVLIANQDRAYVINYAEEVREAIESLNG